MNSTFKSYASAWQTRVLIFAVAYVCLGGPLRSYAASGEPECDFRRLAPFREEAKQIKITKLYTGSAYTELVANHHFIDREYILSRDPTKVYFHVENAVLKMLNDKGFLDKEITAATLNIYKELFFAALTKSPCADSLVAIESGGAYNDFKTIRLVFDTRQGRNEAELINALDAFRREVGEEFAQEMRGFPALAQAYRDSRNPLLKDPSHWHEAGMGRSSAEASLKARLRREADYHGRDDSDLMFGRHKTPDGQSIDIVHVAKALRRVEGDRIRLMHFFSEVVRHTHGGPFIQVLEGKPRRVPDARIFENGLPTEALLAILRTAQTSADINTHDQYRMFIELSLANRFGVQLAHLDADQRNEIIDTLQRYFKLGNEVAPSVVVREQEPIGLADVRGATHGIWSFDITGQNGRNLRSVFHSLHFASVTQKSNADLVDAALELTTAGQKAASAVLSDLGSHLRSTLHGNGVVNPADRLGVQSTGDDFTAMPAVPVTPVMRAKTLIDLANHPLGGGLFRSVLQSQSYRDGTPVRREERFQIISIGEGIEKSLRGAVEGSGLESRIPYEELKHVTISLLLVPLAEGVVRVDMDVAASASRVSSTRLAQIVGVLERAVQKDGVLPSGWQIGTTNAVPKYFEDGSAIWTPASD